MPNTNECRSKDQHWILRDGRTRANYLSSFHMVLVFILVILESRYLMDLTYCNLIKIRILKNQLQKLGSIHGVVLSKSCNIFLETINLKTSKKQWKQKIVATLRGRFHQNIKNMENNYLGRWDTHMMPDSSSLQNHISQIQENHTNERFKNRFLLVR